MEVKFHLPGLRRNYLINMMFVSLQQKHPEYFREGVKFGSFFGEFPTSLWNGGRNSRDDQCRPEYIKFVIKSLNELGIPVRFTYTNTLIEEEDLKDPYCNYCLAQAHNGMNGVIVVSPLLEDYIRKNYPKMKITSSTCKELKEVSTVNSELKRGYDLVVLDYNMNNRFDLLEQIEDKERCEILVNSGCQPDCKRRGAHYRAVSENQKILARNMQYTKEKRQVGKPWDCSYASGAQGNVYTIQKFCTYVSPEDIWEKYVPMGFCNFKIEGRSDHFYVVVEALLHYLIKPEYQGVARITVLYGMECSDMLKLDFLPASVFGSPKAK